MSCCKFPSTGEKKKMPLCLVIVKRGAMLSAGEANGLKVWGGGGNGLLDISVC